MAIKLATRTAQEVYSAEFTFSVSAGDTVANTAGAQDAFGTAAAHAADVIQLPPNSVIISGAVTTETVMAGMTAYNMIVGDSGTTNRYLTTTDKTSAATTVLVPTGFVNTAGLPLRVTATPTNTTATTGKWTVRVEYIIRDRATAVV